MGRQAYQSRTTVKVAMPLQVTENGFQQFVHDICSEERKERAGRLVTRLLGINKKSKRPFQAQSEIEDSANVVSPAGSESGQPEILRMSDPSDTAPLVQKSSLPTTFATQEQQNIGTIYLASPAERDKALKQFKKWRASGNGEGWAMTDTFAGLTVLFERQQECLVDICAIHGLGGNAIDTWVAQDKGYLWLRDFLPENDPFDKSRIMTYGYDSDPINDKTRGTLGTWGLDLIQSLDRVRKTEEEKRRPIIFVCHSLGGLVSIYAMTMLQDEKKSSLSLDNCGAVFLSTPLGGSNVAELSPSFQRFFLEPFGLRPELIEVLKRASPTVNGRIRQFLNLKPVPKYDCFCETNATSFKVVTKFVVKAEDAQLEATRPAKALYGTDHHTVCKFPHRSPAYATVRDGLASIFAELVAPPAPIFQPLSVRAPGFPRFVAHAYPPDGGRWWQANSLVPTSYQRRLRTSDIGRQAETQTIVRAISGNSEQQRITSISGVGGIGKTHLLMRLASQQREKRNVFIFLPDSDDTFESSLESMAMTIGFDMLEEREKNWDSWRQMPIPQRIEAFVKWLGSKSNVESLIIVDDAASFIGTSIRRVVEMLGDASNIILTSRNSIAKFEGAQITKLALDEMESTDTISIVRNALGEHQAAVSREDLLRLVDILGGHPFAAKRAAEVIADIIDMSPEGSPVEVFMAPLQSANPENWRQFLTLNHGTEADTAGPDEISIWDVFEKSFSRLEGNSSSPGLAVDFLKVLPFIDVAKLLTLAEYNTRHGSSAEHGKLGEHCQVLSLNTHELVQIRRMLMSVCLITARQGQPIHVDNYTRRIALLRSPPEVRARLATATLRYLRGITLQQQAAGSTAAAEARAAVEPHVRQCNRVCIQCQIRLVDNDNGNDGDDVAGLLAWVAGFAPGIPPRTPPLPLPPKSAGSSKGKEKEQHRDESDERHLEHFGQLSRDFVEAIADAAKFLDATAGYSSAPSAPSPSPSLLDQKVPMPWSVIGCVTKFRLLAEHMMKHPDLDNAASFSVDGDLCEAFRVFTSFSRRWNAYPDLGGEIESIRERLWLL